MKQRISHSFRDFCNPYSYLKGGGPFGRRARPHVPHELPLAFEEDERPDLSPQHGQLHAGRGRFFLFFVRFRVARYEAVETATKYSQLEKKGGKGHFQTKHAHTYTK